MALENGELDESAAVEGFPFPPMKTINNCLIAILFCLALPFLPLFCVAFLVYAAAHQVITGK